MSPIPSKEVDEILYTNTLLNKLSVLLKVPIENLPETVEKLTQEKEILLQKLSKKSN